jgi:hypothetical protein
MKKICLIGCGNVGSRHLQAIAKLPFSINVDIVEPNLESQELGKKRLEEIEYDKSDIFTWYQDIEKLNNIPDLTIVATTATGRADLLCNLVDLGHSRFLVEKMVCQSDIEYNKIITKFHEKNAKGWVNTNPRCFSSYQRLKRYFRDSDKIHFSVSASNVSALGTNTIHYMDLFSFFTNDYNIKLNGDFLLDEIFPNKRGSHLMEFAGTVIGKINDGSSISMSFLPSEKNPTIVNIIGKNKHFLIDETNQKKIDMIGNQDEQDDFIYEYASSITTKIAQNILEKDDSDLTTLENSQVLHKEIFRIFNQHIKKNTGKNMELCPIT